MLHPFLIAPVYDQGIRLCFPHRKRGQRDAAHLLGRCTDSKEARQRGQPPISSHENAFYFQKHGSVPIHELIGLKCQNFVLLKGVTSHNKEYFWRAFIADSCLISQRGGNFRHTSSGLLAPGCCHDLAGFEGRSCLFTDEEERPLQNVGSCIQQATRPSGGPASFVAKFILRKKNL